MCRCGRGGEVICEACARNLVDRVVEDDRRSRGDLGFKPLITEGGTDLVEFMVDQAGTAVDELHAAAAVLAGTNPEMAGRIRKVADELFAVRKKAKDVLAHRIEHW